MDKKSDIKGISITPYQEFTNLESGRIPTRDIIEILDTPVYLNEDPNVTMTIRETVHLNDIEILTEFRYNNLDISSAKIGLEEEEWTIGYRGGYNGVSYIKKEREI